MKLILFVSILLVFQISRADVATKPCKTDCVNQVAIPVMQKAVLSSSPASPQDPACPGSGSEIIKDVQTGTGKAAAGSKIILELIQKAGSNRQALQNDHVHCGACKQNNLVSLFTTSAPAELRTDLTCLTPFARNFQQDLNNQDIETYVSDVLRGRNPEGQKLYSDCSNTCNLYTASAQTPLSGSASRLNLTILCGPPRQGSIIFANYLYSVGFVHQWFCGK